ncbi:MAG TPA: flagellar biosynthesis protein FlhB [Bacillota bacterium]|nr:flagellar biosynthesis protein FlhB [Bacillota bacterium]
MPLKLDLQFFAEEKTEKATPRKRQDEREKGRVAKSQDVNTAIILLFSFMMLAFYGSYMKDHMATLYHQTFTNYIHWEINEQSLMQLINDLFIQLAMIVVPIMLVTFIASVGANLLQIGFLFTTEPLKFDLKKLDPIQGAKRIFSIRALVELLKSLLKILLISIITFFVIWLFKDDMMMLSFKSIHESIAFFGRTTIVMGISAIIALLFLAVLDYMYQKYDFEKNIRMSKQDIKDEHKDIEGDPLIKSKMKEKQREFAMRRMMSEIPTADVVITNPTHFAVALKYDEHKASAPYIIAMGKDDIALKIIEVAKANDIATVENPPLARSLYHSLDIGDIIPEKFYEAIAEVLAYVYQLENRV